MVTWVELQCVIEVFPDQTHLFFGIAGITLETIVKVNEINKLCGIYCKDRYLPLILS